MAYGEVMVTLILGGLGNWSLATKIRHVGAVALSIRGHNAGSCVPMLRK